ncbi:IS200/IS605 family transposase [Abyssisolibacter fermentans]|uniref:IS200/IS605 family transposase n=1 Tax=Abyssisolibacter fermentans TaxID=1766203 RepID=UPI000833A0F4|nr:IS200/IS605 family transposase [Abyssisolibacter fermentans]
MEYENDMCIYNIKYHIIWVTKYRYKVLVKPISIRLRDLIIQGCEARNIKIIKGSVGKDHVHMLVSCPPNLSPSKTVQYLKGRSSRLLQEQYPELRKRYWGQHLWARGYFLRAVGNVTEEIVKNYIENQEIPVTKSDFKVEE